MQSLSLTKEQMQRVIAHVDTHAPLEACGLLAGNNSKVLSVFEVTNQAQSPTRYVMDPIEQLNAFEWIESNKQELIGIFHSHPAGPETVSLIDIAQAAYAVVYVILARENKLKTWRARGFWIEGSDYSEVTLEVT
jgi:[CysO sulfur-carrier protein]-S-L-cysteine hydrolase